MNRTELINFFMKYCELYIEREFPAFSTVQSVKNNIVFRIFNSNGFVYIKNNHIILFMYNINNIFNESTLITSDINLKSSITYHPRSEINLRVNGTVLNWNSLQDDEQFQMLTVLPKDVILNIEVAATLDYNKSFYCLGDYDLLYALFKELV